MFTQCNPPFITSLPKMNSQENKEYSVNWKNHMDHVRKAFDNLLSANELTDVTLYCEGKKIGAHKMLLSACSAYFRDTFKDVPSQHHVIVLYGVEFGVLSDILHFIYNGEVSVDTSKLDSFLKTAQLLQISGLTEDSSDKVMSDGEQNLESRDAEPTYVEPVLMPQQVNDDYKRSIKRVRKEQESSQAQNKTFKQQENDAFLLSDVKCEPSELVSFEDPLEDPLLQGEQSNDTREFFDSSQGTTEEDFKIERTFSVLDTDTKVKHSNFSEDCLKCSVCSKVFSHPYSLHHHRAVHSGNTQCPICHAVLSRKYNLKMHMKARHNV